MVSLKSRWNKYIAEEKNIVDTKKMFFGKYLYKAEVIVVCASRIREAAGMTLESFKGHISKLLQDQQWLSSFGMGSNYGMLPTSSQYRAIAMGELDKCDVDSLYKIRTHIDSFDKDSTKLVLEKNKIHFYTTTASELDDFLDFIKWPINGKIDKIFTPNNEEAKIKLEEENIILMTKPPKFGYRVLVSEELYSDQTKTNILNYLSHYEDDVHIPKTLKFGLTAVGDRYLSGHFDIKELSLLSFLKIISPGFVKKIYTLAHLPDK